MVELPIREIGLLVLIIIIVLGIILFFISGVGAQTESYQNTSSWVLDNLTQQAEDAKSTVIIG